MRAKDKKIRVVRPYSSEMSTNTLAWLIQNGITPDHLKDFLARFSADDRALAMAGMENGFGLLHFAVRRRCPRILQLLLEQRAPMFKSRAKIPLLAWTIMDSAYDNSSVTDIVKTLLATGADPCDVPPSAWTLHQGLTMRQQADLAAVSDKAWYTELCAEILKAKINLTHRYFIQKAYLSPTNTARVTQIAKLSKTSKMLRIQHFVVGQTTAAKVVMESILTQMLGCQTTPLVFVFAGPSGHGKTELAKEMGRLLSLDQIIVDCTETQEETDLF